MLLLLSNDKIENVKKTEVKYSDSIVLKYFFIWKKNINRTYNFCFFFILATLFIYGKKGESTNPDRSIKVMTINYTNLMIMFSFQKNLYFFLHKSLHKFYQILVMVEISLTKTKKFNCKMVASIFLFCFKYQTTMVND